VSANLLLKPKAGEIMIMFIRQGVAYALGLSSMMFTDTVDTERETKEKEWAKGTQETPIKLDLKEWFRS
jgi:hypothetical protein